jgi:energy-coupling factor transporter ATP-binding protein EcfA2
VIAEFLRKVLPEGLIVVAVPVGKGFRHEVCTTAEEAAEWSIKFDAQGKDVYMGMGGLKQPKTAEGKVRVGTNIAQLKCLFIDLDVGDDPKKYTTQVEALQSLKTFCKETQFPAPMLVNSGGGIHAYWPFETAMEAGEWKGLATTFKAALAAYGLKTDPTITADSARVLRVVGTHNYKLKDNKRPVSLLRDVPPYPNKELVTAVLNLAARYQITPRSMVEVAPSKPSVFGDNTATVYPPSELGKILGHCATMASIAETGGPSGKIWMLGLGVAMATVNPDESCMRISERYPDFDIDDMKRKIYRLKEQQIGPTLCTTFADHEDNKCAGCPHMGLIKSPIMLGVVGIKHLPVIVNIKDEETGEWSKDETQVTPYPYVLVNGKIVKKAGASLDSEGNPQADIVVCPYNLYPVNRSYNERTDSESTLWRVVDKDGIKRDFTLKQSILAKPEAMHGEILDKGLYLTQTQAKATVGFMVAYIKQLQETIATEKMFSRLGWRDNYTKYVLGGTLFKADGTQEQHPVSSDITRAVRGLDSAGTLEGWKEAMKFYLAPGHEAHRFAVYCGFGSPLLHMTGIKGVVVAATGESGAGKTTAVLAANSIMGHPKELVIDGNESGITENALYVMYAARSSIMLHLDEVTRMRPEVFGRFCLAAPQGRPKDSLTQTREIRENTLFWEGTAIATANTNLYHVLASSRADATAEAMRLFQLNFPVPTSHTKTEADKFLRDIGKNYGTAGPVFLQFVVSNYATVCSRVEKMMALVDTKAQITSAERFYSAEVAANFTGAMAARKLGLLEGWPVEQDFEWIIRQITGIRSTITEDISTPRETISEFLEARVGETLVVNQTINSNIAPRVDQAPRGALSIRHEIDTNKMYVMKSEFKRYCQDIGANYSAIQNDLETRGILLDRNKLIVLGRGTDFGKGQVRCWELDMSKLKV